MTKQPMKVGMIGVGGFGGHRRMRMRESGLFTLLACCDRNEKTLAKVCKEESAQPYASYEQMIHRDDLEGIMISTGADSHAALSIQAMRAGKHVFVEKPLCCSVDEVKQLRTVAKETVRVVGVGHSQNDTSDINMLVKQYIEQGKLGTLVAYEENSSHSGGQMIQPGDWRGLLENNPGGMLFQCGVHALHMLCDLFGAVTELQAMMRHDANPNTETADVSNVLLHHASGIIGTLNCYHITAYCHELRIFGTKGNLYIDTNTHEAWYQRRREGEVETREPVQMPKRPKGADYANLTAWYNAVRGQGEANPGLEHGVRAVLPVFAAEISDKQGKRVRVEPDETGVSKTENL